MGKRSLVVYPPKPIVRTTGVSAMQLAVVSETTAIILDKVYVHLFLAP